MDFYPSKKCLIISNKILYPDMSGFTLLVGFSVFSSVETAEALPG